jgi:hypothetical protein
MNAPKRNSRASSSVLSQAMSNGPNRTRSIALKPSAVQVDKFTGIISGFTVINPAPWLYGGQPYPSRLREIREISR